MALTDREIDLIIQELGATPAPRSRAGVRTALTFFARYMPEMSIAQQKSYLKAMDLSKPIDTIDLLPGESLAAFRYHAADFGEFHTRVGADPSKLGILLGGRQFRRFDVVQRVAVLSSFTSAFKNVALGSGGAQQFIVPRASLVLRVTQRGTHTR